jgi:hypothetical protein
MIREAIVTTQDLAGRVHIAPLGLIVEGEHLIIAPFRPSQTLENLRANPHAVANYTDDVQIFAGCLTGRKEWPVHPATHVPGAVLNATLAHAELSVESIIEDELRPRFRCKVVHEVVHAPFRGFNRAQAAVVEAAILVSRLHMLPAEKIDRELGYLQIAMDKTAGPRERQAWAWLVQRIEAHRASGGDEPKAGEKRT